MANEGYWLAGVGEPPKLGPGDMYEPGKGEILIQVRLNSQRRLIKIMVLY